MKKIISAFLLLIAVTVLFASCEQMEEVLQGIQITEKVTDTTHTHQWSAWNIISMPSCTVDGNEDRKCDCGATEERAIRAVGHSEVSDSGKASTCSNEGLSDGKHCFICGEVTVPQTPVAVIAHTETVDAGFAPDCTKNGLSDGKHCTICGYITVPQTALKALEHNIVDGICTVCKKNQPISGEFINPTLGYITSAQTEIVTDHIVFKLPANVYVMDDFVNIVNKVTAAMEEVSGLTFKSNSTYCQISGTTERVYADVIRPEGSEYGGGWAAVDGITLSPCDLVDFFLLINFSATSLQYRTSPWYYCTWAMSGVSSYTNYKTSSYIYENYPELINIVGTPNRAIYNYTISDYSKLYENTLEDWMENTFEYSINANVSIGFRFMWFLDETYGDYTKWISAYEEYSPYHSAGSESYQLPFEEQAKAFKMAYGDDVFDKFYAWMKQNEDLFVTNGVIDLKEAREINFYPKFMGMESYMLTEAMSYRDLCIDLSGGNYYLTDYQNKNISALKLMLYVDSSVELRFYAADGSYIRTENANPWQEIDISGVYYIIFVGDGVLRRLEITGFN